MPKPIALEDIFEHPADAPLFCVVATLKTVFGQKRGTIKTGKNIGGTWIIQNLVLTDGQTEIDVAVKDREEEIPQSWKGREIMLEAHKGDRGYTGLYAIDDDFGDKITRKIKCTPTCIISLVEGGELPPAKQQHQAPAKTTPAPAAKQQQQSAPAQKPAAQKPEGKTEKSDLREATEKCVQIANLQLLCLNTVHTYVVERFKDLDVRDVAGLAMNMIIEMKRTMGVSKMPTHRMETKPKAPEIPATWKGKPWPANAVPHPETGEPMDPETGNVIF